MRTIQSCALVMIMPMLAFLSGCEQAPSYDIMGSFFPGWLICLIVAIVLTAASQFVLNRYVDISWPVVVYPCLTAVYAFALWLSLFH